jgi:hypothetical protein
MCLKYSLIVCSASLISLAISLLVQPFKSCAAKEHGAVESVHVASELNLLPVLWIGLDLRSFWI